MSSFLIWFWKGSLGDYVSHIHSPPTLTYLSVRWQFLLDSVETQIRLFKLSEDGKEL